jgi:hypothetical protein
MTGQSTVTPSPGHQASVATSGTWDLAEEPKREREEFCSQMNDSTDIASYVYLNQERLYAMLTATRAAQIDLSVNLRN